jgi:hypothetical protein
MEMKTTDIMAALTKAPEWDLSGVAPVPMARWGKDHWTTFLYVKTRWVDHRGVLDPEHMRCDRARHLFFYEAKYRTTVFGTDADGGKYPTRLKTETPGQGGVWGTVELFGHDDWDCLNDAVTEGLVEVHMPEVRGDVYVDARGRTVTIGGPRRSGSVNSGEPIPADSLITGMVEGWLMTAAAFTLTPRGQEVGKQLEAFVARTRRSHQFVPEA